jgi:membrane protein DedA with SNARE-associated domain
VHGILDGQGAIGHWLGQWGYWAVFVGVMLESAGIPMPGETILIAATLLATRGQLAVPLVYGAAVLGATIGDNVGYWIGRTGGRALLHRLARLARVPAAEVETLETKFRAQGPWAVFLGRFVALLRTLAGPIAGVVEMPWPLFLACNAAGAVLWAGVVVALTALFGTAITGALEHAGRFALVGVIALAAAWWAWHHWRRQPR